MNSLNKANLRLWFSFFYNVFFISNGNLSRLYLFKVLELDIIVSQQLWYFIQIPRKDSKENTKLVTMISEKTDVPSQIFSFFYCCDLENLVKVTKI